MKRPKPSWRKRSGVTRIEVLAALALLGSLAVAMVLSRGRLREQHALAEKKLEAVEVADAMLSQWWEGENKQVPVDLSGDVAGFPGWSWETESIPDRELSRFDAQAVRLRILDNSMLGNPIELTSVDVVMPVSQHKALGNRGGGG